MALAALKGLQTVNERARPYGVHPTPIAPWKPRLHKEMPEIFSARRATREHDEEAFQAQLAQHIGQLTVEWDGLNNQAGLAPCDQAGTDGACAAAAPHCPAV